jgi:CheY-like chemotaxis protein
MRKLGGRLASQNDSRHTSDESNDGRNAVVMAVSQTPPQQSGSSSNPQTPLPLQLPGAPVLISPSRALLPDPSDLSPPLPPPCYIVCISGNVRSEFVDAAKEAGADEYLGKPFEKQALRNAINQARKKQRAYASDHPPRAVSFDEIHYHPPTSALQVVTPSMVRSSILSAIDSADVPA